MVHNTEKPLSERIEMALDFAGMNQSELADRLGTRPHIVNRWIKEGRVPGWEHLRRLPEVLGVSGHWLLTGTGPMEVQTIGASWSGEVPSTCQVCGKSIGSHFADAKTVYGPWALVCMECLETSCYGLGTGLGQKYETSTRMKVGG